jgi:oxygen-independent coproporphyrinogen-3 oxidase
MNGPPDSALGIYISIPFCRSKCTYCNFASGVFPAAEHGRYVERAIAELRNAPAWAGSMKVELPRRVDTIYLGGGTPTLLVPALIEQIFSALRASFDIDAEAEITVECAPGQWNEATVETLAAVGVNRASLGVQSFVDSETRSSGRLHNRAMVEADFARLRAAGITNLNVDLIAGLAGQSDSSWEESLGALIGSGTPHASIYMLEVDEDSRLGREILQGGARYGAGQVPDDEVIVRMYERAIERLAQAGIEPYEISNFARPGSASRHNLRYWQRRPYLGVGLDASSALRAAGPQIIGSGPRPVLRATTSCDLQAYLGGTGIVETEWLSAARQHEEAWFLGLRMNDGVDTAALEREFGSALVAAAMNKVAQLIENGLLIANNGRVQLTRRGRLLSNEVFQEFVETETQDTLERI